MTTDLALPRSQQPRFLFPAWMWTVLLFCLFALLVTLFFGTTRQGDSYEERRATAREAKFKAYREEIAKGLGGYGWTDKAKGVARIPIDRAMALTLADLRAKKPAPAGPIAIPVDAQASAAQAGAPAPSATPGTSATPSEVAPAQKFPSISGANSAARGEGAALVKPNAVPPGTQPGFSATPASSPSAPVSHPPVSPTGTPVQSPPGKSLPVPGR